MTHQPKPINSKPKKQEEILLNNASTLDINFNNENTFENNDKNNIKLKKNEIQDILNDNNSKTILNILQNGNSNKELFDILLNRPSNVITYNESKLKENNDKQYFLYTFGSNEMGQLGIDTSNCTNDNSQYLCNQNNNSNLLNVSSSTFTSNPQIISSLNSINIISISAGDGHSICVSSSGTVYAWGASACGQLGIDQNDQLLTDAEGYPYQPKPIQVKLLLDYKIKEVACGDAHTLALAYDGLVFSWGGAGCGQLGHSNISLMPRDADACPYQPYPKLIENLKNYNIIHIACGKAHSLAIDTGYNLFTWGAGACGQLGVEEIHTLPVDDDGYPFQPVPKLLKSLKGMEIIFGACGDVHTCILTKNGDVYSFGGGSFGQLGLGAISKMPLDSDSYPYMPTPSKIEALNFIKIVKICCGDSHTMAIDNEGKLYAWGAAACGQLGIDSLNNLPKDGEGNPYEPEPKLVNFFYNIKINDIACGESHSLVLVEGGIVFSFGNSSSGQLGYIDIKDKNSKLLPKSINNRLNDLHANNLGKPRLITSFLGKNIVKISSGGVHNLCLVENETSFSNELYKLFKLGLYCDIEIIVNYSNNYENTNILKDIKTIKEQESCGNKALDKLNKDNNSIHNSFIYYSFCIRAHKYILLCKSEYFKNLFNNKTIDKVIFNNIDETSFRNIIDYLYLEDDKIIENIKTTDQLLDALKLSKILRLKNLEIAFAEKLKCLLSKYSEALQNIDKIEGSSMTHLVNNSLYKNNKLEHSNKTTTNTYNNTYLNKENTNISNEETFTKDESNAILNMTKPKVFENINNQIFKGLFFLPNGNPIIILDENLIMDISKNSHVINLSNNNNNLINNNLFVNSIDSNNYSLKEKEVSNYRLYSQKNSQGAPNNNNNNTNINLNINVNQDNNYINKYFNNINQSSNNQSNNNISTNNQNVNVNNSYNNKLKNNSFNISCYNNKNNIIKCNSTNINNENNLNESYTNRSINPLDESLLSNNLINMNLAKDKTKSSQIFNDYIKNSKNLKEVLQSYNLLPYSNCSNDFTLPPLLKYFNDKDTSDITLKLDNYEFYCHKIILISRSEIFSNMLSENMFKEKHSNIVEIGEYPPHEFFLFLLFLYHDNLSLDIDRSLELLKGVDVYVVNSLKIKLENLLSKKLDIENAAKIFKYSSFYNHDKLKKISLAYINDNYKLVVDSEEFEELPREFMLEIIRFCKSK